MSQKKLNIILLLVVFSLIMLLLALRSVNNNLNYSMQIEQKRYDVLIEDNKALSLKVESTKDLGEISRLAREELGMIFPKKIEYIYE